MIPKPRFHGCLAILASASLVLGSCMTALVHDDVKYPKTEAHCSGSPGVDDSSIAVLHETA